MTNLHRTLNLAIKSDSLPLFCSTLEKLGNNPEHAVDKGDTRFMLACRYNSINIVKYMIQNGVNINERRLDGYTALHIAAQENKVDVVKLLLYYKVDCNVQDDDGLSSLTIAVKFSAFKIVKLLLCNGANPKILDKEGNSILYYAIAQGHIKIIKLLLEYNASHNENDLFASVRKNSYEITKLLLQNGANPNAVKNDVSVFMEACESINLKIIKLLIKFGCDVNWQNSSGCNVLHIVCAEEMRRGNTITFLLKNGAAKSINTLNSSGKTPIDIMRKKGRYVHLIDYAKYLFYETSPEKQMLLSTLILIRETEKNSPISAQNLSHDLFKYFIQVVSEEFFTRGVFQ